MNAMAQASRLLTYWLTIACACWIVFWQYGWNVNSFYDVMVAKMITPFWAKWRHQTAVDQGLFLLLFGVPLLFAASVSYLLLTNTVLTVKTVSWITSIFAKIRPFPLTAADEGHHIYKKNQFLKGEYNFDVLSLWLLGLPMVAGYFMWLPVNMDMLADEIREHGYDDARIHRERVWNVSLLAGFVSITCLSFFLIPVARHSVLLVAMGWSPVHALRLHIWAGHVSFWFALVHAVTMVMIWIMDPFRIYENIFPPSECWAWNAMNAEEEHHRRKLDESNETIPEEEAAVTENPVVLSCNYQWFNLTGIFAMIMFTVLWVSSLHWFRRRNYRFFYLMHVTFGSLMLITTILHYAFIVIWWLPSLTYYLASTSPTLIQALASRFRGGVKITKVIPLEDAAGCVEVHVATNEEAAASLNREASQFVKLCVPKISVVWHPFTVFAHPRDPTTLRFLFRPVGPFTTELAKQLTAPTRPVTVLDGFYKGSNRVQQALDHDSVTIVCGGVALTPFLSMIPAVLTELSKPTSDESSLRTISLHWSCREKGLMNHITKNYFALFQEQAQALGRVRLEITIYFTGKRDKDDVEELASKLESVNDISDTVQNGSSDGSAHNDESSGASLDGLPKNGVADGQDAIAENSTGLPMEVGRMMPGRFSKFYFNIPVFIAWNAAVMLGHAIIFEPYDLNHNENYKQMALATIMTLVMTVFFGIFGILVESITVRYWPRATFDDFYVFVPPKDDVKGIKLSDGESEYTSLNVVYGRFTEEQFMATAHQSEAPGIFMCGPTAMTSMVWQTTRKENSFFGRTRFCVYDEPFEF